MIDNKTSVIYLAHGPKHLHRQSIFSILTLAHFLDFDFSNVNIVVYTDDQEIFRKHLNEVPLHFEMLDAERIKSFIKNDYVHRVKICVIQDCMKKYRTNTLFVDGDTYFLKSPIALINRISKDYSVFHQLEFTIADGGDKHEVPMWLTLRKLARNYEYTIKGERIKLSFDSQMWNSGILGISKEHYDVIEDVLDLNDQMTAKAKFKTAEQFAFAYILKRYSVLITGDDFVYHYWEDGLKKIYNFHIALFLNKNLNESLRIKAGKAIELYLKQNELRLPEKSLLDRVKLRCELIWKVAKHGRL